MHFRNFEYSVKRSWIELSFSNGKHNFITRDVLKEMKEILEELQAACDTNCVILKGEKGGFYSHGIDRREFNDLDLRSKTDLVKDAQDLLSKISNFKIPIICAIEKECFGAGFEMILACDIRIAGLNSKFASSEIIFGLIAGGGAIQRLLHRIGRGRASRLLLTGMTIDATTGHQLGIIEDIAKDDEIMTLCRRLADRLSRIPRQAVIGTKSAICHAEQELMGDAFKYNNDLMEKIFAFMHHS